MPPHEAADWLSKNMLPYYPLGVFKEPGGDDLAPRPTAP
jgi:hypothetical protein